MAKQVPDRRLIVDLSTELQRKEFADSYEVASFAVRFIRKQEDLDHKRFLRELNRERFS